LHPIQFPFPEVHIPMIQRTKYAGKDISVSLLPVRFLKWRSPPHCYAVGFQSSNHRRLSDLFKWVQFYWGTWAEKRSIWCLKRDWTLVESCMHGGSTRISFLSSLFSLGAITDLSFCLLFSFSNHAVPPPVLKMTTYDRISREEFRSFGVHIAFMSTHGRCCCSNWFRFNFPLYV
jgi:hypothetical protein